MNILKVLIALLITLAVSSCKDRYDISSYHAQPQSDSLLADIITYVYVRAPYAEWNTRFDSKFRKYYVSQLNKFSWEKYFVDENGVHYFYIIRPARSPQGNTRGVGGKFRLDENGKIISFEELFNTPVASLPILKERGTEMFMKIAKGKPIDDYLKHPDYVEWPDKQTFYDTVRHEWTFRH